MGEGSLNTSPAKFKALPKAHAQRSLDGDRFSQFQNSSNESL
jgi:hypothetical protein